MTLRQPLLLATLFGLLATGVAAANPPRPPIPVVLDTDIGTDIDDTWALAQVLRSPELDLKLVLTETGDARYRAAIAAKILEAALEQRHHLVVRALRAHPIGVLAKVREQAVAI